MLEHWVGLVVDLVVAMSERSAEYMVENGIAEVERSAEYMVENEIAEVEHSAVEEEEMLFCLFSCSISI